MTRVRVVRVIEHVYKTEEAYQRDRLRWFMSEEGMVKNFSTATIRCTSLIGQRLDDPAVEPGDPETEKPPLLTWLDRQGNEVGIEPNVGKVIDTAARIARANDYVEAGNFFDAYAKWQEKDNTPQRAREVSWINLNYLAGYCDADTRSSILGVFMRVK